MSNLIKALKRAEQDREAARQAQLNANSAGVPDAAATSVPLATADGDSETAVPAVMRLQRDAVKPAERVAPRVVPAAATSTSYQGVAIALGMAVLFAVAFGMWIRGQNAGGPVSGGLLTTHDGAHAPSTIPAALRIHDAGPLELRLDRGVEAIGQSVRQRVKAQ